MLHAAAGALPSIVEKAGGGLMASNSCVVTSRGMHPIRG